MKQIPLASAIAAIAIAAAMLPSTALSRPEIHTGRAASGLGQAHIYRTGNAVRLLRADDRRSWTLRRMARKQRPAFRAVRRGKPLGGTPDGAPSQVMARPAVLPRASSPTPSAVVNEARRHIGTNPTGWSSLWCARFMNQVLEAVGFNTSDSDLASSFASYGTKVNGPRVGAIAVMRRGRRGGHVGVVSAVTPSGDPVVISGNYGRKVAEAEFPREKIQAYVMPH